MSLFHHLSSMTDVRGRFKNTLIECFNIFGFHLILTCKLALRVIVRLEHGYLWGYVPSVVGFRTVQYGMYVMRCVCDAVWLGFDVVSYVCGVVCMWCGVVWCGMYVMWCGWVSMWCGVYVVW